MADLMTRFAGKLQEVLLSKRAVGVLGANALSLTTLPDRWQAIVLCVSIAVYVASDTAVKIWGPKPPVSPTP